MANRIDDCALCEDLLAVREWLTEEESRELATHLSACPACRRREHALAALAAEFASAAAATRPDPVLTERIMMATASQEAARRPGASSPLIPALAALVALELIAVSLLTPGGAELAASLASLLEPVWTAISGMGADLAGVQDDLASALQEGWAVIGLDLAWLLTAMAAGIAAVFAASRRENPSPIMISMLGRKRH